MRLAWNLMGIPRRLQAKWPEIGTFFFASRATSEKHKLTGYFLRPAF